MKKNTLTKIVADSIRSYRKQRSLTIEALAEKAGIDSGFLGHIEVGSRVPSLVMLGRISEALGVSPSDLLLDPTAKGAETLDRRLLALWTSLGRDEKGHLLAVLSKLRRTDQIKGLRSLLGA